MPIPAANVRELPAADGTELDAAAAAASELLDALGTIDLTLLGMGPDAHVASLFPGHDGVREPGTRIIAVRDSPKPPPERLSFTLDAINASDRVWLIVAGADKAEAVALARSGATADEAPAGADEAPGPGATGGPVGARRVDAPEAEAIDLLDAAGGSVLKRVAPIVSGLLVLLWALRRRRR